ncbi:MAG TPA: hypothetical protein VND94_18925 [Terriglobia bacterium]|nr:hypothetical protein [Terriglobia bacterium]
MRTPTAILAGFILVAMAVLVVGLSGRAGAQGETFGRYAIAVAPNFFTVLDTTTGDVRVCIINGSCNDWKRQQ